MGEASQERKASTFSEGTSLSVVLGVLVALGVFGRCGNVVDVEEEEEEEEDVNVADVVFGEEDEEDEDVEDVDEGIGRVVEDAAVLVLVILIPFFFICVSAVYFVCNSNL